MNSLVEDFSAYDHIPTDKIWEILDDWGVMLKEDPNNAIYYAQSAHFFQSLAMYRRRYEDSPTEVEA